MSPHLLRLAVVVGVVGSAGLSACGARTGLLAPAPAADAGCEGDDGSAGTDAPLPPIDASPGVAPSDCPDAGDTVIYLVTAASDLLSFYPPTAQFTRKGRVSCPVADPTSWTPFSMAVDRQGGMAYVLFSNQIAGQLFGVSTATGACSPLPYVGDQDGFATFGMAFVGNPDGGAETLYLALNTTQTDAGVPKLAVLDVATFRLSAVEGIAPPSIENAELTGTGDGRLFAFYATDQRMSSAVAQLDPSTGRALGNDNLTALPQVVSTASGVGGWAFAFWGNEFYLFTTSTTGGSLVTRFNPADGSQTTVATLSELVVGAGVSTCAPQQ